jgi:thiamine-phosphate pyrophosphorylase
MARSPLLYYITDRTQFPGDEPARRGQLLQKIKEAAKAGVEYIQLREKDLSAHGLEDLAREAMRLICVEQSALFENARRTKLLINSRTDLALAVGADGVHLRSKDISIANVRKVVQTVLARNSKPETRNFIVAVSCHSEEEVRLAAETGADFVVFAPVFEKREDPALPSAGLSALDNACRYGVPVFALGGVTIENADSCLEAGAAGMAGIRLFQQNEITEVVRSLRK